MCQEPTAPDIEVRALCHFRFFVYREYREMRHLGGKGVYDKFPDQSARCRKLAREGKEWFAQRYRDVSGQQDIEAVVQPFEEASGLTLEQVYVGLSEGEWDAGYGGRRHAAIVALTIALRQAIEDGRERGEWRNAEAIVDALRRMEHNNRVAIQDYVDLKLGGPCCILPKD